MIIPANSSAIPHPHIHPTASPNNSQEPTTITLATTQIFNRTVGSTSICNPAKDLDNPPLWEKALTTWTQAAGINTKEKHQRIKLAEKIKQAHITNAISLIFSSKDLSSITSFNGVIFPENLQGLSFDSYLGSFVDIQFPKALTHISIENCEGSLTGISLPQSIVHISLYNYKGNLEDIAFPNSLKYLRIKKYEKDLDKVSLPASLNELHLINCNASLKDFSFPGFLKTLCIHQHKQSLDNVLFPESLESLEVSSYKGPLLKLLLPKNLKCLDVSFSGNSLLDIQGSTLSLSDISISNYKGSFKDLALPLSLKNLSLMSCEDLMENLSLPASLNTLSSINGKGSLDKISFPLLLNVFFVADHVGSFENINFPPLLEKISFHHCTGSFEKMTFPPLLQQLSFHRCTGSFERLQIPLFLEKLHASKSTGSLKEVLFRSDLIQDETSKQDLISRGAIIVPQKWIVDLKNLNISLRKLLFETLSKDTPRTYSTPTDTLNLIRDMFRNEFALSEIDLSKNLSDQTIHSFINSAMTIKKIRTILDPLIEQLSIIEDERWDPKIAEPIRACLNEFKRDLEHIKNSDKINQATLLLTRSKNLLTQPITEKNKNELDSLNSKLTALLFVPTLKN